MHPIQDDPPTDQTGPSTAAAEIRVLYVEDNPNFAALAETCLEDEAGVFDIEHVTDPTDALDRLTDEIDCIVSGYKMPEMNGIELLKTVRETHPNLPFILFTAKGSEAVASEAISAGVTDYLQKGSGTDEFTILANRVTNAVSQRETETALVRQNHRLDTVVSNLPVILFAFDQDGVITLFRGNGVRTLGLDSDDHVGKSVFEVYADHESLTTAARQALAGEATTAKHELAGQICETTYQPIFDDSGTVRSVIGIANDITERAERERELEAERRRFRNLFEELAQPTVELEYRDNTPIVAQVNPAFEEVFGYAATDVIGASLDEYIVPEDRQDEAEAINETVQDTQELAAEEVTRQTADGLREFLLQNAVFDGGDRAFAIYTDITERQERQHELEILRTAVDNAHNPLVLTDPSQPDNPISYVNEAFERVTGYSQSEAMGRNCRFLQGEDTDPEAVATIREAIAAEEECTVELRNYRKDGTMFWNRLTIQPVYNDDGEVIRYFGSQEDITERKESRDQLERQNDRLEEFASAISHDLRNPLNVAQGRVEIAQRECESEHLDYVSDAHERMETLIDELLTLARQGETVNEPQAVNLASISEQCWQTVDTAAATLTVTAEQTITADRNRLQQLFENLVRNAIEHGGEDVAVTVGELDDAAGFYIADDGPGIPAADRGNVFENGYTTDANGTGLGLAIVKEIADAHGWDVTVTESDDGGARFEFMTAP